MPDRPGIRALLAGVAPAVLVPAVHAESPRDRYWAQLEYFLPKVESSARPEASENGPTGTRLSMEDDLGLRDCKGTPYLLLGTRLV